MRYRAITFKGNLFASLCILSRHTESFFSVLCSLCSLYNARTRGGGDPPGRTQSHRPRLVQQVLPNKEIQGKRCAAGRGKGAQAGLSTSRMPGRMTRRGQRVKRGRHSRMQQHLLTIHDGHRVCTLFQHPPQSFLHRITSARTYRSYSLSRRYRLNTIHRASASEMTSRLSRLTMTGCEAHLDAVPSSRTTSHRALFTPCVRGLSFAFTRREPRLQTVSHSHGVVGRFTVGSRAKG